ncbi:oleate activated transcription factor [Acrasis kona]|uniref:Oleate activated transcription factor n=1 Tax=Acrasis kona TaxID=1008807 RepID=A0AAW2Z824_9EUKA
MAMMVHSDSSEDFEETNGQDIIEDGNAEVAPIACSNCRRSHRRCDRKLPACGECLAKRKKCTFLIPRKRGPGLVSTNGAPLTLKQGTSQHKHGYHPYNLSAGPSSANTPLMSGGGSFSLGDVNFSLNNSVGEQDMIQRYMAAQTMDIYFEIVCLGFPLMERHKMELLLYYQHNVNATSAPPSDELALMYSIQAFCYQRIGQRTLAQQFFERSRGTLSTVFDQVMHSFPVAACYCYLAYYLTSDDELSKAKFFLHNVNQYLDHRRQQYRENKKTRDSPQQMVRETFLQQLVVICNILIQNSLNDFHGQLFSLGKLIKLFHTLTIYKQKAADPVKSESMTLGLLDDEYDDDDDPEKLCRYMDHISIADANSITEQCKHLPNCKKDGKFPTPTNPNQPIIDCVRVERISVAFQRFFDTLSGKITEMQLDILKLTFLMIAQGVKIQMLVRSGGELLPMTVQTADRITALTATHWYAMCPPLVVSAVANAALVHIKLYESGVSGEERLKVMSLIREDLRALNVMKGKYNLVSSRYADTLVELEKISKHYDEQQAMFISFMDQMNKPKAANKSSVSLTPQPHQSTPPSNQAPAYYDFNFDAERSTDSNPFTPQSVSISDMENGVVDLPSIDINNQPPAAEEELDDFINTLLNDNTLLTPTRVATPDEFFMH